MFLSLSGAAITNVNNNHGYVVSLILKNHLTSSRITFVMGNLVCRHHDNSMAYPSLIKQYCVETKIDLKKLILCSTELNRVQTFF